MTIPLKYNQGTAVKNDILYTNDRGSLLAIRIKDDSYEIIKTIAHDPVYYHDVVVTHPRSRGWGCSSWCTQEDAVFAPNSPPASTGSSFATFAVIDDYLYYLNRGTLMTADISQADDPKDISQTHIGWTVETLYPTDDYLFLGGTRGMYIFDRSDPTSPEKIGKLEHFRACDPVVVSGNVAYVTLRGGNRCGESRDVLLCVNIEDPASPVLIGEKALDTPYGLAVEDPLLYVSTGFNGFELLDVAAPTDPSRIEAWSDRPTRDFIWSNDLLYTLGFDRFVIFDVSTPGQPVLLSEVRPDTDS
jgi:hypothetical protein